MIILLCVQWGYGQYTIPEKPQQQTSIYDYAELLNASDKKKLERKLISYADTTSTQIVIAIIENLEGENIGLLAPRWGHKWGIGQAEEDNGIFILLAKDDRKIWIAPGYGAEEKLTAGITGEIVRNVIIPEFKAGSYYRGLDSGTSALMEVLNGTYTNTVSYGKKGISLKKVISLLIVFIVIIISIIGRINRRNGGRGGGRSGGLNLTDILILTSLGKGGFGGSSSSGGGSFGGGFSGGFGGGGFSGGGAGGSW